MEFARGSIRKGVKPIANSGVEVLNTTGNELWAQREAVTGPIERSILIANELCLDYGLFNISAPSLSRVKGPPGLDRC